MFQKLFMLLSQDCQRSRNHISISFHFTLFIAILLQSFKVTGFDNQIKNILFVINIRDVSVSRTIYYLKINGKKVELLIPLPKILSNMFIGQITLPQFNRNNKHVGGSVGVRGKGQGSVRH
jgi:hypothetical protein